MSIMKTIAMYDKDIAKANGDREQLEIILRSKWLFIHRGLDKSTVHQLPDKTYANIPEFEHWVNPILSSLVK